MRITFLITTCNRPKSCQDLVDFLQGLGGVVVVNDGCDYTIAGCKQIFLPYRHGRRDYLSVVKTLFGHRGSADYYIMLPDDFIPVEGFTDRAIELWEGINDPQKICLNLINDRQGMECWTRFIPIDRGEVWHSQWVDMCFLAEDRFFRLFSHFTRRSGLVKLYSAQSSGVGAYISRLFHRNNYGLYQVKETFLTPQEEHSISQMHDNSTPGNTLRKTQHSTKYHRIFGRPGR